MGRILLDHGLVLGWFGKACAANFVLLHLYDAARFQVYSLGYRQCYCNNPALLSLRDRHDLFRVCILGTAWL